MLPNPVEVLENAIEVVESFFVAPAPELAMLGDLVEVEYGHGTLIGTVVEGEPYLDEDGKTWFRVERKRFGYYGYLTVSHWTTDEYVVRIISKA